MVHTLLTLPHSSSVSLAIEMLLCCCAGICIDKRIMLIRSWLKMTLLLFPISFKNGSLTREGVRNRCADGSWEKFEQLLASTPAGNNGNIGKKVV